MSDNSRGRGSVSAELDNMTCDVIGACLDELALEGTLDIVACVEDEKGARAMVRIDDDGEEACIEAARDYVARAGRGTVDAEGAGHAVRYAVAALGFVEDEGGVPCDALLVSFGEKGAPTGYSAYVFVDGLGQGDGFMWSDPEPAGEEPLLL